MPMLQSNHYLTIIEDAKKKNAKEIGFNDTLADLSKIPGELKELNHLEVLDLGRMPLLDLGHDLSSFTSLRELKVRNCHLSEIPKQLMALPKLKHVTIGSDAITTLPNSLGDWADLTYLNVSGCQLLKHIKNLPPKLVYLNIGNTSINSFDWLSLCSQLAKLVVNKLNLSEIPKQIFDLATLTSLFFPENQVKTIPIDIIRLSNLDELVAYRNDINKIPAYISKLRLLKHIHLGENRISKIPQAIGKLKHLHSIELNDNLLIEIPEILQDIKSLQILKFQNSIWLSDNANKNNISVIPDWLLKLNNLKELNIDANPIENVPVEIVKAGLLSIKNYIQSKIEADSEEFLLEAKIVMVGRGNVGKTVLTKKLSMPGYKLQKSDTTKGIDVLKNPFNFPFKHTSGDRIFRFNIWDFGGQEKYDATHQLFITDRSIYLFLTEAREESNYSDLQFWLNTISFFSHNSPVIVVLSKCDERKKLLQQSLYKEKFKNIIAFVDVSSAEGYEDTMINLKREINNAITKLPQITQKLSNRWVDIRNELEDLSVHSNYLSYNEYLGICKKHGLNTIQADFLSQFLNDLGVIVHHTDDLLLKNTVFINTDWVVDGMYRILDDENVFRQNGRFGISDLHEIWGASKFANKSEHLLKLLKDYNLCFELTDGTGYIAPELLPPDKPEHLKWDYNQNLRFEIRYTFMPAGIITRFIVKSNSFIKSKMFWKHGVVLEYEDTRALIIEDYINRKITLSIAGNNKKGLLTAVRIFIEEVHNDFDKNNKLETDEMVPCNCVDCVKSISPHFYKYSVLTRFEQAGKEDTTCEKSILSVPINSLINDVRIKNPSQYFETNADLKNYILEIINIHLQP